MKLMCVSQIDLRKRCARQALITDIFLECILSGMYLHNWLILVHAICSSTYMYMKNVNDVTGWLYQTTDISKYFVWSPGL